MSEHQQVKGQSNKGQLQQEKDKSQLCNPSHEASVSHIEGESEKKEKQRDVTMMLELEKKEKQKNTTMMSETVDNLGVALRTVPVYLKSGNRRLKVNALLDDASTKTYINADVAAELGIQVHPQRVNVSVLNGQVETFETTPIECALESVDGESFRITAFTANRVTGNMNVIDWNTCSREWSHLKGLKFHQLGPRPIVDLLIGLDCADLQRYSREARTTYC